MLRPVAFLSFMLGSMAALANELPSIRLAVLKIGTVNWELSTIAEYRLDAKHGFKLNVRPYADNGATRIALEGGEADMAVADWIWVARQRASGKNYVFVPYSRAMGGLVVPSDSPAKTLEHLAGQKLGIAGGPLDKSWLILRAYALEAYGFDLKAETEQVFGAPPLIFRSALDGDSAGAINYWHFLAKMKAAGMKELVSVDVAARALGLDPKTPLIGYYFKEEFASENPGLVQAFYEASRDAKTLLSTSDKAWDRLRPMMDAETHAEFAQLRRDWIAGIPQRGQVDLSSAQEMLGLMRQLGGNGLVGEVETLPPGLFADIR